MKTLGKLSLLTSLYFSQGLPFGFFTVALPVMMRSRGVSLPLISAANVLALPWALKFLWAPFVDRHGHRGFGRRKSWIVPLQLASIATSIVVSQLDPGSAIPVMMGALFFTNLLAATQDIATDGLAVELLDEAERGHGNSIQVAGYRLGMVLGGSVLLTVFGRVGWFASFATMAGLLALATVPILLHRERPAPHFAAAEEPRAGAWFAVAKRPGWGAWLAVLGVYKCGEAMAASMVKPLFVDRGMSMEGIGWLIGAGGSLSGFVGALLGGLAVTHLGRKRALLGCGMLQVAGVIVYILPAAGYGGSQALVLCTVLEHVTGGMATVSIFTIMMDACGDSLAGTEYTLQASVFVIATGVAGSLSGFVAKAVGYPAHFAISAAFGAIGLAAAAWGFGASVVPPRAAATLLGAAETGSPARLP